MECLLWRSPASATDEARECPACENFLPAKLNNRWKKGRLPWIADVGVTRDLPLEVAVSTDLPVLGVWEPLQSPRSRQRRILLTDIGVFPLLRVA